MLKTLNTYAGKEKEEYLEEYRNSDISIRVFCLNICQTYIFSSNFSKPLLKNSKIV